MINQHTQVKAAIVYFPEFSDRFIRMQQKMILNGMSMKTFQSYIRNIARLSLELKKLPECATEEEINAVLTILNKQNKLESRSGYKHMIYGLRYYLKMLNSKYEYLRLPSIKQDKSLPLILSKAEIQRLFLSCKAGRQKLMLMLIYSAGLRAQEAAGLKLQDIDWDRKLIHIKNGKGGKDRYVPLSMFLINELKEYLFNYKPVYYLFNNKAGRVIGTSALRHNMHEVVKRAGLLKKGICLHTLRHSYATHLLEDGLNIVSIKELLGHANIEATLVYLHVANYESPKKCSPLDNLYDEKKICEEEAKEKIKWIVEFTLKNGLDKPRKDNQLRLFEIGSDA